MATPPTVSATPRDANSLGAIEPDRAKPRWPATEPRPPIATSPAMHLDAARRQFLVSRYGHDALPHRGAVLHARDDLLADEAALGEGDAVELIEQRLVRK